jgi:hypothetical protein
MKTCDYPTYVFHEDECFASDVYECGKPACMRIDFLDGTFRLVCAEHYDLIIESWRAWTDSKDKSFGEALRLNKEPIHA